MDKFQAAFEVLFFMSMIDGSVDKREADVVVSFLESNLGKITFLPSEVIGNIQTLTGQGAVREDRLAASVVNTTCSAGDKVAILNFAISLIAADNKVRDEEIGMLIDLGNQWGVDVQRLLKS
jgi:hypothetical protein